jgi:DNA-binding SARP family transcriptional activator
VTVDRLVDVLWGDRPPPDAAGKVHVAVSRLRRLLADAGAEDPSDSAGLIVHRGGRYALAVSAPVDVDEAAADLDSGRRSLSAGRPEQAAEQLDRALRRWQGSPLADVTAHLQAAEGPGLTELHVAVQEESAQAALAMGRYDPAIAALRRLLAGNPLRERPYAMLVTVLGRTGRLAEASAVYDTARHRLAAELGISPGRELRQAYETALREPDLSAPPVNGTVASTAAAVAADQPAPPRLPAQPPLPAPPRLPAPTRLPAQPAFFVGRDADLRQLEAQLVRTDARAPRRVLITGVGGVGKTALALWWSHQVGDRFPDGRIMVDLRGYDADRAPLQVHEAVTQVLAALRVPPREIPPDEDAALGLYYDIMYRRSVLLVLDNAHSSTQVRPLLPPGTGCFALVTSRDRLTGLVAHDGAYTMNLSTLDPAAAGRLIGEVAGRAFPASDVAELARLCGNLPLALRIAGARLAVDRRLSPVGLADDLADEDLRISGLTVDRDDLGVRVTFAASYRRLPPTVARAFRRIGGAPCDELTPASVAALLDVPPADVRGPIDELVEAGLLQVIGVDRYSAHDLLRLYARERATAEDTPDDLDAAHARLVGRYLDAADRSDRVLRPMRNRPPCTISHPPAHPVTFADQDAAMAWLDAEYGNLAAITAYAARRGWHEATWQLAECLHGYHYRSSRFTDWLVMLDLGLQAAVALGDRYAEGRMHGGFGIVLSELQRYDDAIEHLLVTLEIAEDSGDPMALGRAHGVLSGACGMARRFDECEHHTREAYRYYCESGEVAGQVTALLNLGTLMVDRQRYPEAATILEGVLADSAGLLDGEQEYAEIYTALVDAYAGSGRPSEALATGQRGVAEARRRGYRSGEAKVLRALARCQAGDDPAAARTSLLRALDLYRELDHPAAEDVRLELAKLA